MDPTNPENEVPIQGNESEESEQAPQKQHSPELQARFNELTGQLKAQQEQVQELIRQNAELARQALSKQPVNEPVETLPEGVDPSLADFIKKTVQATFAPIAQQNQQMFGQILSRQDMQMIETEYSGVDPEVKQEAARVYSIMKKKYPDASLEDAMDKATMIVARKRAASGDQRNAFNTLPGVIRQGAPSAQSRQKPAVTPPTQDPNWNNLDWREQAKRVREYEQKTGQPLVF